MAKSQITVTRHSVEALDQSLTLEDRLAEIEQARQALVEAARQRLDARMVQHVEFRATEIIDGMLASASVK